MTFKYIKEITLSELNNVSGNLINCDNGKSYWLQIDSDTSNIVCTGDDGDIIFEKPHDESIPVYADGKTIIDGISYLCFASELIDFNNIGLPSNTVLKRTNALKQISKLMTDHNLSFTVDSSNNEYTSYVDIDSKHSIICGSESYITGNNIESVLDSVARFERGLINKERLVWDGSIKSTREIIELLGDTVGHDTISQEKFHDYVDSVRRSGLSHPKLGSQVLEIGSSLRISDFR